jgi:hypothetical protein
VDTKFTIFILLASVLTTAVFASTINFVSASTTTCFHFGGRYLCYFVFDEVKPPAIAVTNCDNDGTNCTVTWVQKVNVTPDAKDAIEEAQIAKFGGELSPDAADNSANDKNSTSPKSLKIPPKLEMPNLK